MRVSVCVGLVRVFFGGIVGVYMFFFLSGAIQVPWFRFISPSIPPVKCIFIRYGHTLDTRPRSF